MHGVCALIGQTFVIVPTHSVSRRALALSSHLTRCRVNLLGIWHVVSQGVPEYRDDVSSPVNNRTHCGSSEVVGDPLALSSTSRQSYLRRPRKMGRGVHVITSFRINGPRERCRDFVSLIWLDPKIWQEPVSI